MKKIVPHLWFDREAREAAELYVSAFGGESQVNGVTELHDTPSGDVEVVSFEILGQPFMAISAGPLFKPNPSISFHLQCGTKDEVDAIWERLSNGGKALMELGSYPFSERYGWIQDRYGFSWQVIYTGEGEVQQRVTPALLFVGDVCGKAEEAVSFYTSVFSDAEMEVLARYAENEEPEVEGTVKYARFALLGQEFGAMDSARAHDFNFNEAISLIVYCKDQQEVDYYWERLSAIPEAEQCGWLKDRYGVSWQIVPAAMDEMMQSGSPEQIARLTKAFLKMKKFDIAELQRAYAGR